ncbi:MAG: hypothetical protein U0V72_01870 [Cytophagales bacterium]
MFKKSILIASLSVFIFSCKKEEKVIQNITETVQLGTYDNSKFKSNTVNEREFYNNYKLLLNTISTAKPGSVSDSVAGKRCQTLDLSNLQSITNSGVIKISDLASDEFKALVLAEGGYLSKATEASKVSNFIPNYSSIGTVGGRYALRSGYLFDQYGIDIEELVQKSYFGAFYDKVFNELLLTKNISLSNIDKALVYYGAPTSFPNGMKIKVGSDSITDMYVAQYAARRDNSNGVGNGGFYSVIKAQFITLQQTLKKDSSNTTKIESTVSTLRENWEKALMATAINYLQASKTNFTKTADTDKARALHAYGEVAAMLQGFKGVKAKTIISQTQIDELLVLLNFSNLSATVNPLKFFESQTEQAKFQTAVTKIQSIYGFTDEQVNTLFIRNDVSDRNIGIRIGE